MNWWHIYNNYFLRRISYKLLTMYNSEDLLCIWSNQVYVHTMKEMEASNKFLHIFGPISSGVVFLFFCFFFVGGGRINFFKISRYLKL